MLSDPITVVGAVLEGPQFHPGRTGRNHLRVLATAAGLPDSRVEEVLRLVELEGAGEQAREGATRSGCASGSASPARCSATRARWCSTSPPTGSTRRASAGCATSCARQAAAGRTVLVSSHVLAEMAQTVDEVVVISHGRLVAQGSLDELTSGVEAPVWVRSADPDRLQAALGARDGVTAEPGEAAGGWLAVRGASLEDVGTTALESRGGGVRAVPAAPVARERVPRAHERNGGGQVISASCSPSSSSSAPRARSGRWRARRSGWCS